MSVTVTLSPRMEQQAQAGTIHETSFKRDAIDDIRKDVPEVSNLFKWWARLRAHEDQEARRKRSLNKGKDVVRGEVQTLSVQQDANCSIPLEHDPTGTGSVLVRDGRLSEASSSEGRRTGSRIFGLELPRPPPPVRDAPLPPSQPAELPSSSTVPLPPPPVRAPPVVPQQLAELSSAAGTIPVRVQFTKFERLKELELRSSTALRAREIRLSNPQIEKLRTFSEFVGTPNQITLFGRQLPQCHRYVVEIERKTSWQTYICIEGLKKEEDIRDFYAVMSQRKYRKYYEPWKICFRMVDVSRCAATPSDPQGMQEVDATCHINLKSAAAPITLCGSLIRINSDQGERISTIGGIIQIGSGLFALTTAHSPSFRPNTTTSTPATSYASTFRDEDFPNDVEKPLVISEDGLHEEIDLAAEFDFSTAEEINPWTPKIYENQKEDWCLIQITERYQLPNTQAFPHPNSRHSSVSQLTRAYAGDPSGLPVCRVLPTLDSVPSIADEYEGGVLAYAPSFLDGLDGPVEVWAVNSLRQDGFVAGRGISGSWFVDITTNKGEVVGSLVARAHGRALIVLLSRQLQSIWRSFPSADSPILPRPETMLLRAARTYCATDRQVGWRFMEDLFDFVGYTDSSVLSAMTLTLRRAVETMNITNLQTLIKIYGSDLESVLKHRIQGEEELVIPPLVSTLEQLVLIYQQVERDLAGPHGSKSVAAPSKEFRIWPAPTRAPPTRPRSPIITSGRQEDPDRTNARTTPRVRLRRVVSAHTARVVLYCLITAGYLAGIGVGAWKLLDSGLSFQVKIVVGVLLIVSNIAGIIGLVFRWRHVRLAQKANSRRREESEGLPF